MLYSPLIDKLLAWLTGNGVKVHLFTHDLGHRGGMYRSETREIFLNESIAVDALMVLAHEAGHWIGYQIKAKPYSYQRERQAFAYGWKILT